MAAGQKKVIVRPFTGDPLRGYLPGTALSGSGELVLLDPGGRLISLQMREIKWIAYVRDFNLQDALDPERLGKRTFPARPRAEGLWAKWTFRDGDVLEGLAAANLALLDDLLEDGGLFLAPPETRSNTQRLFVPRTALAAMELLGVIRSAVHKTPVQPRSSTPSQPGLFED